MSATAGLIGVCERLPEDAKRGQGWAKSHHLPGRVPSDTTARGTRGRSPKKPCRSGVPIGAAHLTTFR